MNRKKFIASITALACCAGMMSIMPELGENTYASELVNNDFEVNYDGWYGNADSVNLIADSSYGYENTRGMLVSGRISPTDGASSSKGFYLSGGVNYDYSIQVYSENTEKFHLSLLYIDEDTGEETTVELTSKDVEGGKWTKLSAEYKAPENSYEFRLTITTDSTNDFCFDNVLITTKQKKGVVYAESTEKGLKDEFANYFRVGNILNGGTVQNSTITATILKDFNSIECENETKPDATLVQSQCSGTNIGVSLNSCASIMDFCVQNNIAMRGHTLVWHSQTPEWFFKTNFDANGSWVDTATMDARMESYIKNMFETIATQYPSLNLYAYDVANECISDDSNRTANYGGAREGGYGDGKSPWVQVYGDNSFVEKAFTYARKYAPSTCALYYNDYNEYWDHKRDAIYNMCKSLYEKGLLDGVGMQSHVPANATGFAGTDSYIEAMKKYLSIGCDVQITELDISIENGNYTYDEQAEKYKAIFQAAIDWNKNPTSSGRVTAVCIWGPNDANSWLSSGSNALLYDSNNQPKTAYYTLSSMLPESEWGDGSNPNTDTGTNSGAEPNDYGWYFYDSFEESESDWKSRGSNTIGLSGRTSYVGTNSLLVSDRTAVWNGAEKSLDTSVFKAGEEYSFSVCVSYLDGADSEKFSLTLQYTGTDGETHYANIDSKEVVKGNFVQLYNKNYKIPDDVASDLKLVVETTGETMNFYMDEAIGAVAGTTIVGPEPVETTTVSTTTTTTTTSTLTKYLAGDANCDGIVDIADAVAVAGYVGDTVENSLSDEGKINADVQGNGNGINAGDALMIQQYLAKIVDELTLPDDVTKNVAETTTTTKSDVSSDPTVYMNNVRANLSEYAVSGITDKKDGVDYGTLTKYTYYSTTRERMTNVNVLLPAGYNENEKYPVLYALHGYWENEDTLVEMGKVQEQLGNLIASGEAEKMIIVFPYIYTSKTQESCSGLDLANSLNYDNFVNDLKTDLMPYIESNFSVKTGRENTAITGFSMGGRESLFIGLTNTDLFGYIGATCPAPGLTPGSDLSMHPGQLQESELTVGDIKPYLIFITGGTSDSVVFNQPSTYHDILTTNGVDHVWHTVTNGEHNSTSVQPHMYNYLRSIFKVD